MPLLLEGLAGKLDEYLDKSLDTAGDGSAGSHPEAVYGCIGILLQRLDAALQQAPSRSELLTSTLAARLQRRLSSRASHSPEAAKLRAMLILQFGGSSQAGKLDDVMCNRPRMQSCFLLCSSVLTCCHGIANRCLLLE